MVGLGYGGDGKSGSCRGISGMVGSFFFFFCHGIFQHAFGQVLDRNGWEWMV